MDVCNLDIPLGHMIMQKASNEEPTIEELEDYAQVIDIDIVNEKHLFYIAREGFFAELPKDWLVIKNAETQEIYYKNSITKEICYDHPLDDFYREKVILARKERMVNEFTSRSILKPGNETNNNRSPSGNRVAFTNVTNTLHSKDSNNIETCNNNNNKSNQVSLIPTCHKSSSSSASSSSSVMSERVTSTTPLVHHSISLIPRLHNSSRRSSNKHQPTINNKNNKSIQTTNFNENSLSFILNDIDFENKKQKLTREASEKLNNYRISLEEDTHKRKLEYEERANRQMDELRKLWENKKHLLLNQQENELAELHQKHEDNLLKEKSKYSKKHEEILAKLVEEKKECKKAIENIRHSFEVNKDLLLQDNRHVYTYLQKLHYIELNSLYREFNEKKQKINEQMELLNLRHDDDRANEQEDCHHSTPPAVESPAGKSFDINTATLSELEEEKRTLERKIDRVKTLYKDYKRRVLAVEEMAFLRLMKTNCDLDSDEVTLSLDITAAALNRSQTHNNNKNNHHRNSTNNRTTTTKSVLRPNNLSIKGFPISNTIQSSPVSPPKPPLMKRDRHSLDCEKILFFSPPPPLASAVPTSSVLLSSSLSSSSSTTVAAATSSFRHSALIEMDDLNKRNVRMTTMQQQQQSQPFFAKSSDLVQRLQQLESHLREMNESPSKENSNYSLQSNNLGGLYEISGDQLTYGSSRWMNVSLPVVNLSPRQMNESTFIGSEDF